MNWGTKLVLGMGTFMSFIIVLAVMMFTSKTDALVEQDYYEKGIQYDDTFNKKEQVRKDQATPQIKIDPNQLQLSFIMPAKGIISMIRNSDKKQDQKIPFQTDSASSVSVPLKTFKKGTWKLIVEWNSQGLSYLYEQEIRVP